MMPLRARQEVLVPAKVEEKAPDYTLDAVLEDPNWVF
jgi:hypothetical protein